MHRVLRSGGLGYFVTPFLQAYHAYPNHYQNYTLEGHNHLLRSSGFKVVDAGTCVGPTFMILDLFSLYLRNYVPTWFLSRATAAAALLLTKPLRLLDHRINRSPEASILASTVYALVEKPGSAYRVQSYKCLETATGQTGANAALDVFLDAMGYFR